MRQNERYDKWKICFKQPRRNFLIEIIQEQLELCATVEYSCRYKSEKLIDKSAYDLQTTMVVERKIKINP